MWPKMAVHYWIYLTSKSKCFSCENTIKLTHYYCYFSKVHRCIECAEQQNIETAEKLKRYTNNENAILVFDANQIVDVRRVGCNMQPKN
jgi:hypothetical protein